MGFLMIATMGALTGIVSATGEEIGWRGLLVPELAKIASFRTTALVSGVIWASFHFPLLIGANYRGEGTPVLYSLACFTLMIVALSVILAWVTAAQRQPVARGFDACDPQSVRPGGVRPGHGQ